MKINKTTVLILTHAVVNCRRDDYFIVSELQIEHVCSLWGCMQIRVVFTLPSRIENHARKKTIRKWR